MCVSLPRRLFQQPQRDGVLVDGGSAMLGLFLVVANLLALVAV